MLDPIEVFLQSPVFFTLGFFLAVGLALYKRLSVYLRGSADVSQNVSVVGSIPLDRSVSSVDLPHQNFSGGVLTLKENDMDVKNIKEVLLAVDALVYDIVESMKVEGTMQIKLAALLAKLLADKPLQDKFIMAFEGYENIPAEAKELSPEEMIELAAAILPLLVKYFKK